MGMFWASPNRFSSTIPTGGLLLTYFKMNDHQYIEIFPEPQQRDRGPALHVAFETTDMKQLRDYLASRGVTVPAAVTQPATAT